MNDFSIELSFGQIWIDEYDNELKVISAKGSEVKLIMSDGFIVTRSVFYIMTACEYRGEFDE